MVCISCGKSGQSFSIRQVIFYAARQASSLMTIDADHTQCSRIATMATALSFSRGIIVLKADDEYRENLNVPFIRTREKTVTRKLPNIKYATESNN